MYAGATPDATLVAAARRLAQESSCVVVAAAPVTDTVKAVADGFVGSTVDREGLLAVRLPVVVPASLADSLGAPGADLAAWVERVRERHTVRFLDVRG